jgi:hypothetical protein
MRRFQHCWWQQGVAGFAMPSIDEWSVVDTSAGGQTQQHSAQLFPRLLILCAPVVLATKKMGYVSCANSRVSLSAKGEGGAEYAG